jgi:hypothetical protein
MPGKRVQFDDENWQALYLLGRDQMKIFQELADEAFKDLLKKNDRLVDLKDALRRSAGHSATAHKLSPLKRRRAKRARLSLRARVCIRRFGSPGLERPAPILS